MGKFKLVVFTSPVEGRDAEYNDWYNNQHLPDVTSVPGFSSAQRFKVQKAVVGGLKQGYLALYEMDAETTEQAEAASAALSATPMFISEALDLGNVMAGIFESCAPKVTSGAGKPAGRYRFSTLVEPIVGREDEYNGWYVNQHMGDVIKVPGFVNGERYQLRKTIGGEFPAQYFALFSLSADSEEAAGETLKTLFSTDMPKSDAGQRDKTSAILYEACSGVVSSPKEKATA